MKGVRARMRVEWVKAVLGDNRSFTVRQFERCRRQLAERGWLMAAENEGPAFEKVVAVTADSPAFRLVRAYARGRRWFEIAELSRTVGTPIFERAGADRLAAMGFALAESHGDRVELCVADPRAARFINESRLGPQTRGFSTRGVIEAFMLVRSPGRCRVNVSDARRLATADVLKDRWHIECDDLLGERRRVRLVSSWTVDGHIRTSTHASELHAGERERLAAMSCGEEVVRGS